MHRTRNRWCTRRTQRSVAVRPSAIFPSGPEPASGVHQWWCFSRDWSLAAITMAWSQGQREHFSACARMTVRAYPPDTQTIRYRPAPSLEPEQSLRRPHVEAAPLSSPGRVVEFGLLCKDFSDDVGDAVTLGGESGDGVRRDRREVHELARARSSLPMLRTRVLWVMSWWAELLHSTELRFARPRRVARSHSNGPSTGRQDKSQADDPRAIQGQDLRERAIKSGPHTRHRIARPPVGAHRS